MRALPDASVVAALPETQAAPTAVPGLEGRQLILALQTELNRVGCYTGTIDGDWGNMSRLAVEAFSESAGVAVAATDPTPELLDTLKSRSTVVCTVEPGATTVADIAPPASTAGLSQCVILEVRASDLDPNGAAWDSSVQGDPEPDILVSELTTGATVRCDDSYTCQLRIQPQSETLSLRIVDYDRIKANELMGEGQCRIGGQCIFPNATVTMSGC
jgi:peptidoglycan hydrolase-like protein with peptidoglycan-binding domain